MELSSLKTFKYLFLIFYFIKFIEVHLKYLFLHGTYPSFNLLLFNTHLNVMLLPRHYPHYSFLRVKKYIENMYIPFFRILVLFNQLNIPCPLNLQQYFFLHKNPQRALLNHNLNIYKYVYK